MKKQSTVSKILNLLNTKGGFKPKDIIKETKLSPASVYVALSKLHKEHKLAKEEDGVYISQTQTSVSDVTNKPKAVAKRGRPRKTNDWKTVSVSTSDKSAYTKNLEKENLQLTEWTQMWKRKYEVLERDYTQAKVMYLNSQAVVAYLEEKVAQLIKG
jgi:DNA-binding transcriptional regulator PaaX